MSSPTPPIPPPQNPVAPPKKINPLVWILGGVAVLFFGVMLTCGLVGFLAVRAVKNAGFDPELMKNNPGLAMAKMMTALHPDLERVSVNERAGTITMREKSTGKMVTFKFDPVKQSMVVTGEDGSEVKVTTSGDGKSGSLTVQSSEGTLKIGATSGNVAPAWVPLYPDSTPENTSSAQTPQGDTSIFTFKTKDASDKVIAYFQDKLKAAGFTVTMASSGEQSGMVQAEDGDKKRSLLVSANSSSEGTQARVVASEKK
jgi:hypothetical protein